MSEKEEKVGIQCQHLELKTKNVGTKREFNKYIKNLAKIRTLFN